MDLIPSWGLFGLMLASWALLGPLFFVVGRICVRSGVLKRFFFDLGSILGGFWLDLGRFWG